MSAWSWKTLLLWLEMSGFWGLGWEGFVSPGGAVGAGAWETVRVCAGRCSRGGGAACCPGGRGRGRCVVCRLKRRALCQPFGCSALIVAVEGSGASLLYLLKAAVCIMYPFVGAVAVRCPMVPHAGGSILAVGCKMSKVKVQV